MSLALQKKLAVGFDEALTLLPEALKAEGFGVLTEIDLAQTLKNKIGVELRRYKILGACNPRFAHEALSSTLEIGVMLPCNVAVYEGDDGKAVVLAIDPTRTMGNDPQLGALAVTVRDRLAAAIARV